MIFVAYFLEVGLLLLLVPWSTFWERNYFVKLLPLLQALVEDNFVRGAVSGLGLVNLTMGFTDLASVMSARRTVERVSGAEAAPVGSRLVNEE